SAGPDLLLGDTGVRPHVYVVLIKGCTQAADHEALVTQHRAGPGLSIASYTRSSLPFPVISPALGSVRCPVCLSAESCGSAAELTCPAESAHCYSGVLLLSAGSLTTHLKVQGCMSQAGCNLLNGTQEIGPINLRETCDPKAILTCHRGIMFRTSQDLTQKPVTWSANGEQLCNLGEVCQETLLLIDDLCPCHQRIHIPPLPAVYRGTPGSAALGVSPPSTQLSLCHPSGLRSLLMGSKGCSKARTQDSQAISIHSGPPGVFVASFARFCSSDKCNSATSSSVLLNSLPHPAPPAPGDLQCPTCLSIFGSCTQNSDIVRCPKGTSHCYKGHIALR
ncbi:hypothetical protein E2I00_010999, partial [Balaenoptera physalus]